MSNRVRELREARGYTQQQLAFLVGVADSTLRRWESDESVPPRRNAHMLARRLGVTLEELELPERSA